jgi:hypothetical protein
VSAALRAVPAMGGPEVGRKAAPGLAAATLVALAAVAAPVTAADYTFDLSEIEARALQWDGFLEGRYEHFELQPDAPLYPLNFAGPSPRRTLDRYAASFELGARYQKDVVTLYGRASGLASHDAIDNLDDLKLLEAGLRISPSEGLSVDLGKQVQRWGKGYAWNPVAFFERPKDPNDPALSREGFVMARADFVRSLSGTVQAIGVTPVLLPTDDNLNRDFGPPGHLNPGARLYLLVADTDIDLLWAGGGSRPQRFGADFSRNIGSQLEVHGEWARTVDATRRLLAADGSVRSETITADSWLLGLRYITEREVTWIAELYRNGLGYDEDELATFYRQLEAAFASGASSALQDRLTALAQAGYGRASPGRHYAYLRLSAKEPFDWLYFTPALTAIANVDDGSWQITPEAVYTGWTDFELRARLVVLGGDRYSEFGAKPSSERLELRLRWFF